MCAVVMLLFSHLVNTTHFQKKPREDVEMEDVEMWR